MADLLTRIGGRDLQRRSMNATVYGAGNAVADSILQAPDAVEVVDKAATDLQIARMLSQKYSPLWNLGTNISRAAPVLGIVARAAPVIGAVATFGYPIATGLYTRLKNLNDLRELTPAEPDSYNE